jgi:hypothetical protein
MNFYVKDRQGPVFENLLDIKRAVGCGDPMSSPAKVRRVFSEIADRIEELLPSIGTRNRRVSRSGNCPPVEARHCERKLRVRAV